METITLFVLLSSFPSSPHLPVCKPTSLLLVLLVHIIAVQLVARGPHAAQKYVLTL
jgi:hypothetical protein